MNVNGFRHDFAIISEWFYENYMIPNPSKCHFLTLDNNELFPDFSHINTLIEDVTAEKILRIVVDSKLRFKSHLKDIRKKAKQKLSSLSQQ